MTAAEMQVPEGAGGSVWQEQKRTGHRSPVADRLVAHSGITAGSSQGETLWFGEQIEGGQGYARVKAGVRECACCKLAYCKLAVLAATTLIYLGSKRPSSCLRASGGLECSKMLAIVLSNRNNSTKSPGCRGKGHSSAWSVPVPAVQSSRESHLSQLGPAGDLRPVAQRRREPGQWDSRLRNVNREMLRRAGREQRAGGHRNALKGCPQGSPSFV